MQMLLSFTKDAMAVLGDSEVVKELNVHCTKMNMEGAILLFYTGNYTEAQWDSMALAVNKLMKPGFDFEQHMVKVLGHVCASHQVPWCSSRGCFQTAGRDPGG
jgi:hypothetical protein